MSDVLLYQADGDGGEIDVVNGEPALDDGIETAVYLSLFGGNEDDPGLDGDTSRQWWGNAAEPVASRRYRSETQYVLHALAAVPANLRRVEDAAVRDLQWMVTELGASVAARATIPGIDRITLQGAVVIDGARHPFKFEHAKAP